MRPFSAVLATLLALATLAPARADDPAPTHDIALDDYFTLATLFEAVISPDGRTVAYTEARWQESTNDRKADLWVVDAAGGAATRLTFDRAGYHSLCWSPDSAMIYVVAGRKREGAAAPFDGKAQVWRIPRAGGEMHPVTQVADGVGPYALRGDGLALYYLSSAQPPRDEWSKLRGDFKDVQYGHASTEKTEVHRLDLDTWRTEKMAEVAKAASEFDVAPDGSRLALITAPENKVSSFEGKSVVEVYDVATGQWTTLPDELWRAQAPSPYGRLNSLHWSPDGRTLAFIIGFDGYPSELLTARFEGATPTIARLPRPAGVSLHAGVDSTTPIEWRNGQICFPGEERGRVRVYAAKAGSAPAEFECLTPGDVAVDAFSFSNDGAAALVMGTPTALADIQLLSSSGELRRLTNVNPQTAAWKWPRLDTVRWQGAGGVVVEGILELPAGAEAGKPLPLIVFIHGGPTSMWTYQRSFNLYSLQALMSAKGYAILCPNYRGSSGYGDMFLTDLIGHENDLDVADILAGVDALVERKIADPDRMAVIGWSNGGYLTNCIVSKTNRFKAASSGAGIADKVLNWGINDEPAYALVFAQGLPWQKPDVYRRSSPVFDFGQVRTPTLFHVGANDERCPPENSRMLYRALREYSATPTELLIYPNEPHGLGRLQSRKAKLAWDAAWFDRYVKGEEGK